jgi:hypothetical protein
VTSRRRAAYGHALGFRRAPELTDLPAAPRRLCPRMQLVMIHSPAASRRPGLPFPPRGRAMVPNGLGGTT